jgi:hypothetical protein
MKVKTYALMTLMLVSSLPALAQEPPPPVGGATEIPPPPSAPATTDRMGIPGQLVLAADLPFNNGSPVFAVVRQSTSSVNGLGDTSSTTFEIAPSADYFVAPNISLGGLLAFAINSGSAGSSEVTAFAIGVRAGYSMQLADSLSLWARLGIGYVNRSATSGSIEYTNTVVPLTLDLPLLWHPASHFFIGAGPSVGLQLSNSYSGGGMSQDLGKTTLFGLTTMIGGYFGGT